MCKDTDSPQVSADEIRRSERRFVKKAGEMVKDILASEYVRLRAYAIEGCTDRVEMRFTMACAFRDGGVQLEITTTPRFHPMPLRREVQLDMFA